MYQFSPILATALLATSSILTSVFSTAIPSFNTDETHLTKRNTLTPGKCNVHTKLTYPDDTKAQSPPYNVEFTLMIKDGRSFARLPPKPIDVDTWVTLPSMLNRQFEAHLAEDFWSAGAMGAVGYRVGEQEFNTRMPGRCSQEVDTPVDNGYHTIETDCDFDCPASLFTTLEY